MITTVAVAGYRSLRDVVLELGPLTVITGPNGSGKSSLYQAFRLLAELAHGQVIGALARAGGFTSVRWAGPETISAAMRRGEVAVEGTGGRRRPISLQMGFASDEIGYLADLGLPQRSESMFDHDPELKREVVWSGPVMRPAATLVERKHGEVKARDGGVRVLPFRLDQRQSLLDELADPVGFPEVTALRRQLLGWRFYDHFRTDPGSPVRAPQVGTWTPALAHDGTDLAAAIATVLESAYAEPWQEAVAEAFDGARVAVTDTDGWFSLQWSQPGLLRPLGPRELSDGTLRFLLLLTALLSPRPPSLLVLNEPETSLHPGVVPVLARLIAEAAQRTQVVVVSHAGALVSALGGEPGVVEHELEKQLGETRVAGQGLLSRPTWNWGSR